MALGTGGESLAALAGRRATMREEVFQLVKASRKALTRSEIAEALGMRTCSATARVKELIDLGRLLVMGSTVDPATRRRVELLVAV